MLMLMFLLLTSAATVGFTFWLGFAVGRQCSTRDESNSKTVIPKEWH